MESARSTFAVFATIVGGVILAVGLALSFGSPDAQVGILARGFFLSCLILHSPWLVQRLPMAKRLSDSVVILVVLTLVTLASLALPPRLPGMANALAIAGAAISIPRILIWLFRGRILSTARIVAFAGLLGCYMAAIVWGAGYSNALVVSAAARGEIHRDQFYHASMASMLQTYGVNSTGIDGTPYTPYHFGSHWMFAQWSKLLDVPVFFFYNLAFPVLFLPIFVHSVLCFGLEAARMSRDEVGISDPRSSIWFWVFLLTVLIGFLPYQASKQLWIIDSSWTSESMCIAVAFSLYLLAAVLPILGSFLSSESRSLSAGGVLLLILTVPALWLLGATKISIMLILLATAGYAFLRLRLYRDWRFVVLTALAFAGGYMVYRSVINPYYATEGSKVYKLLGFVRVQISEGWGPYYYLLFFVWYWIFLWVRLTRAGVQTFSDLVTKIRKQELLDLELLTVLTGAAVFPSLVMEFGDTYFFADYYRWPVVGLLLAYLLRRSPTPTEAGDDNRSLLRKLSFASLVPLVVVLTSLGALLTLKTFMRVYELEQQNMAIRGIGQGDERRQVKAALRQGKIGEAWHLLEASQRSVEAHPDLRSKIGTINLLCDLNKMPLAEKRKTALFIPKRNRAYWDLLDPSYRYWPTMTTPLIAPALSGMAMIWGYPDGEREFGAYGYDSFQLPSSWQHEPDLDRCRQEICKRATQLGFSQVLAILQREDGTLEVVTWNCS